MPGLIPPSTTGSSPVSAGPEPRKPLAGAGLLSRSFTKLTAADPGFSPSGVVALQVFAYDRNPTADHVRAFFDATLER